MAARKSAASPRDTTKTRKTRKKIGRPTTLTKAMEDHILTRIAMGESVKSICADEKSPAAVTVYRWARENDAFGRKYREAQETRADTLFDDILEIADDSRNDWIEREIADGKFVPVIDREALQRSKLRVDTRFRLIGQLSSRYRDKTDVTVTQVTKLSDDDLATRIAQLEAKRQAAHGLD
ncbi:MAG: terminase small subunit protein [Pseudomonadota bacterium]